MNLHPSAEQIRREIRRRQWQFIRRVALFFLGWCLVVLVFGLLLGACSAAVDLPTTPTAPATVTPILETATEKIYQARESFTATPAPLQCTVTTGYNVGALNLRVGP